VVRIPRVYFVLSCTFDLINGLFARKITLHVGAL
jgi:hypothetical protein